VSTVIVPFLALSILTEAKAAAPAAVAGAAVAMRAAVELSDVGVEKLGGGLNESATFPLLGSNHSLRS
jgi:hypothetical protein